jgi:putative aldouronate transport system substrate-binding protein
MNRLYKEGIIDENFFTMDVTQVNSQLAEKRVGVIRYTGPYLVLNAVKDFQAYHVLSPVTSPSNPKKVWPGSNPYRIGSVIVSSKVKSPEVAMRFLDYIYSQEGSMYAWNGAPASDAKALMGMWSGWYLDDDNNSVYPDVVSGKYPNVFELVVKKISPFAGVVGNRSNLQYDRMYFGGHPNPVNKVNYNPENGDHFYRISLIENLMPYVEDPYPINVYFSQAENIRLTDLRSVIKDYVDKETAKFITGANSLENLDKYYSDLNTLGITEYQNFYVKAYDIYQRNMKK